MTKYAILATSYGPDGKTSCFVVYNGAELLYDSLDGAWMKAALLSDEMPDLMVHFEPIEVPIN